MRESEGALPNTLALSYAVCGYVGGFVLMAATPWWVNAAGVLLTAHAMVIATSRPTLTPTSCRRVSRGSICLTINFGYHNTHHERASVPWYRLPALHRELFGGSKREFMSVPEVLRSFHRNRLKRVLDDDYGSVGEGPDRADRYVGAHGVSFLTVV